MCDDTVQSGVNVSGSSVEPPAAFPLSVAVYQLSLPLYHSYPQNMQADRSPHNPYPFGFVKKIRTLLRHLSRLIKGVNSNGSNNIVSVIGVNGRLPHPMIVMEWL